MRRAMSVGEEAPVPAALLDPADLDPAALGFMCGLEIHQQLATGKLHSRQPSTRWDLALDDIPADWGRVRRRLRAAAGDGGAIDVAARFEARRRRQFEYIRAPNAGLVELDDAPPQPFDAAALDVTLLVAAMLQAHPVPALQVMRKTVVDGSNTSGFQRTTLVATGGSVPTERGEVGVSVVCLEEDSARKLGSELSSDGERVTYTLDRLGVPLIEIATEPEVIDPEHAKDLATALGGLLRDTGQVRRGLGSIRQDLNVSIACGDRVEIKGCQDLQRIPEYIRIEMRRQLHLFEVANDLRAVLGQPPLPADRREDDPAVEAAVAAAAEERFPLVLVDLSELAAAGPSQMLQRAVKRGDAVLGVRLPGLAGRLVKKDPEHPTRPRLGAELAAAAGAAGVRGIIQSDELPGYGLDDEAVAALAAALACESSDAFALCAAPAWQAELALEAALGRARAAHLRIEQEVRAAQEDGTTKRMRPLPGGARMYPETDIRPHRLTPEAWQAAIDAIPAPRSERIARLQAEHGISGDLAGKIVGRGHEVAFLDGVTGALLNGSTVPATAWATWLDQRLQHVATAAGLADEDVPRRLLAALLAARADGDIATDEGALQIAEALLTSEAGWPLDAAALDDAQLERLRGLVRDTSAELGLQPADGDAVGDAVAAVLAERADFVKDRGMGALGPLMGVVMAAVGQADGKQVSAALRAGIQALLEE